jgi:AcrR family transcriptional regulator
VATVPPPAFDRGAQLYAAAVELFLANGYHDVDVAQIVAAAGVSHGTFYNYFANKRAVLDIIQRTVETDFAAAIAGDREPETLTDSADFIADFEARIIRAARYMATHAELMEFVTLTGAGVDDDAFTLSLSGYRRTSALITALLTVAAERGWVRADIDLEFAGQAVTAAVVTTVLPVLLGGNTDFDADGAAHACSAYLLSGMRGLSSAI